jgi:hypothetical protein
MKPQHEIDAYRNQTGKALEALHVAAAAIKKMEGVSNVSVDNDNDSGEIFFSVGDREFKLNLTEE